VPGEVRPQRTARRENGRVKKADDILTLTVCEPAMGSAVLERSRQPAGRGLSGAQAAELKTRIPTTATRKSCKSAHVPGRPQRVRRGLEPRGRRAGRSVLWLNAIYGERRRQRPALARPRALVWLPALCRQQPHRRAPSGLQRRRAQERRQARLV
jgi:hypothetical protein